MADVRQYTEQIANAKKGKDVRASIVAAINAVSDENNTYNQVKEDILAAQEEISQDVTENKQTQQNFNDDLEEAKTVNASLQQNITAAGQAEDTLEADITAAGQAERNLEAEIGRASCRERV